MQENPSQQNYLRTSVPTKYKAKDLKIEEVLLNIGPQHPATHGILRLEVILNGEIVVDVVPHIGYLHRCFEKHTESLTYPQIIPYVDRMDYLAAMNSELAYVMGVERMLGIDNQLPQRISYIRVLVAELNRIASHFLAIGSYGIDLGATTAFLWILHDREHILRLFEWLCGARMLYNFIWIGGLSHDLPDNFIKKCYELIAYLKPKLKNITILLTENPIFIRRTANIGILPRALAINYGVSGPILRASGLRFDLRKIDGYSIYPELSFDIPIGRGAMGSTGDCWDRMWVRVEECKESIKIIEQCLQRLESDLKTSTTFDPHAAIPKKIRPAAQDLYIRAENPRGELGFFFRSDGKSDKPLRCKARAPSFSNLAILPEIARNHFIADLVAIVGSLDIVLGEVDR